MATLLNIDRNEEKELRAQKRLADLLPPSWIVTTNLDQGRFDAIGQSYTELDCVIICPYGVYNAELKNHSGHITPMLGEDWIGLDDREKNPYKQSLSGSLSLKNLIKHKTGLKVFVNYLVVFSNERASISWQSSNTDDNTASRYRVTKIAEVAQSIKSLAEDKKRISEEEVLTVVRLLLSMTSRKSGNPSIEDIHATFANEYKDGGRHKSSSGAQQTYEAVLFLTADQASQGALVELAFGKHKFEFNTPAGLQEGSKIRLPNAIDGQDAFATISLIRSPAASEPHNEYSFDRNLFANQSPYYGRDASNQKTNWPRILAWAGIGLTGIWFVSEQLPQFGPPSPPRVQDTPQQNTQHVQNSPSAPREPVAPNEKDTEVVPSPPPPPPPAPVPKPDFAFNVCNQTNVLLEIALSARPPHQPDSWIVKGWLRVPPAKCGFVANYMKGHFYAVARGPRGFRWGANDLQLCVRHLMFERVNFAGYNCAADEYTIGFQHFFIDLDSYTWTLTGNVPIDPGRGQYPSAPLARSVPSPSYSVPFGR